MSSWTPSTVCPTAACLTTGDPHLRCVTETQHELMLYAAPLTREQRPPFNFVETQLCVRLAVVTATVAAVLQSVSVKAERQLQTTEAWLFTVYNERQCTV